MSSTGTNELMLLPKPDEETSPDSLAKKAAVHPSTVEKIGNGKQELTKAKKTPRKRAAKKAAATKVTSVKPMTEIWQAALVLADGNDKRLLTVSETSVIVMNHPNQFKK